MRNSEQNFSAITRGYSMVNIVSKKMRFCQNALGVNGLGVYKIHVLDHMLEELGIRKYKDLWNLVLERIKFY